MLEMRIGCTLALSALLAACADGGERRVTAASPPTLVTAPGPIVLYPVSPGSGQPSVAYVPPPRYGIMTGGTDLYGRPEIVTEPLGAPDPRDGGGSDWVLPD